MNALVLIILNIFLFVIFDIFFSVLRKIKRSLKQPKKSIQEEALERSLDAFKNTASEDDLIRIYEKSKLYNENSNYDILVKILTQLIKKGAFPKEVTGWFSPKEYELENLIDVMEEYVALRNGTLKDAIAIKAYLDGFIPVEKVLSYVDKSKYPRTVAAFTSDPENYDYIRSTLQKEEKLYK